MCGEVLVSEFLRFCRFLVGQVLPFMFTNYLDCFGFLIIFKRNLDKNKMRVGVN